MCDGAGRAPRRGHFFGEGEEGLKGRHPGRGPRSRGIRVQLTLGYLQGTPKQIGATALRRHSVAVVLSVLNARISLGLGAVRWHEQTFGENTIPIPNSLFFTS